MICTNHYKTLEKLDIIKKLDKLPHGHSFKFCQPASTLLNAGKTTNFIYEIVGGKLSKHEINEINSINSKQGKILNRISAITKKGCRFKFIKTEKVMFHNNLTLIDSCLPKLLAEAILYHYLGKPKNLFEIVQRLEKENPLNYNTSSGHKFYDYKLKRFLTDVALGMMPSKVWDGIYDATGGYLIVKEDGEIVSYHVYKKNEFEAYLLNNTFLETAGSSRHNFGKLYQENNKTYIKLNLQVRFIK